MTARAGTDVPRRGAPAGVAGIPHGRLLVRPEVGLALAERLRRRALLGAAVVAELLRLERVGGAALLGAAVVAQTGLRRGVGRRDAGIAGVVG
jgi:hypothetical protein